MDLKAISSMKINAKNGISKFMKKKMRREKGIETLLTTLVDNMDIPDSITIEQGNNYILDSIEKVSIGKKYQGPAHNLGMKRRENIRLRLREGKPLTLTL